MKGYKKQVIYIKNTGSRHFEEAYFVIRGDIDAKSCSSKNMVEEANRIIKENLTYRKRGFLYSKWRYMVSFVLGAVISFLVCFLFRI